MASVACLTRQQVLRCRLAATGLASWILVSLAFATAAHAQIGSARYSSIVVDATSGSVLEEVNADEPRHPASLTKMMTLYLTFEALRDRRITLDEAVPVSPYAASMEPSKLGLLPGSRLTVEQAILGLVTKSANDAAAALGELLGGSEDRFAQMMTLRGRALGMNRSTFMNASGLPDPEQWTTARDLAILSRRLINDFPNYYGYFSTPSFSWHRQVIFNHDNMLRTYPGADGLKTGYTEASGHNLVTSAMRGGVRLIGVVMGAASNGERDIHMASLLDHGFEQLDVPVSRKPLQVAARVTLIASAHAAETTRLTPSRTHSAN
jgi:D-alanyl-D-alanine carboxypeptidase